MLKNSIFLILTTWLVYVEIFNGISRDLFLIYELDTLG